MDDYTPTTEEVRDFCVQWGRVQHPHIADAKTAEAFYRWLAARDREVAERERETCRQIAAEVRDSMLNGASRPWGDGYMQGAQAVVTALTAPSSPVGEESD